jgi:hypothetical protein
MESLDEQLIREALAVWNLGDWDAVLERSIQTSRGGTDIRAELEEIIEVESGALALIRWRARSPAGLTVDQPVAFHFEIHDHVVTRFVSYWEGSQAFEALGLPAPG